MLEAAVKGLREAQGGFIDAGKVLANVAKAKTTWFEAEKSYSAPADRKATVV